MADATHPTPEQLEAIHREALDRPFEDKALADARDAAEARATQAERDREFLEEQFDAACARGRVLKAERDETRGMVAALRNEVMFQTSQVRELNSRDPETGKSWGPAMRETIVNQAQASADRALTNTASAAQAHDREIAWEARRQAMRAVCAYCRNDVPFVETDSAFHLANGEEVECYGRAIKALPDDPPSPPSGRPRDETEESR